MNKKIIDAYMKIINEEMTGKFEIKSNGQEGVPKPTYEQIKEALHLLREIETDEEYARDAFRRSDDGQISVHVEKTFKKGEYVDFLLLTRTTTIKIGKNEYTSNEKRSSQVRKELVKKMVWDSDVRNDSDVRREFGI